MRLQYAERLHARTQQTDIRKGDGRAPGEDNGQFIGQGYDKGDGYAEEGLTRIRFKSVPAKRPAKRRHRKYHCFKLIIGYIGLRIWPSLSIHMLLMIQCSIEKIESE